MSRKIIQLIEVPDNEFSQGWLTALCDDGTIWYYSNGDWHELDQPIPQD